MTDTIEKYAILSAARG